MSRSIKKGPFVKESLLKKIEEMNANGEIRLLRLGQDLQQFSHK